MNTGIERIVTTGKPVVTTRVGAEGLAQERGQSLAQGSRRPRRRATPAVCPASVTREHLQRMRCPHCGHLCWTTVKAVSLPTVVGDVRNMRRTHNREYRPAVAYPYRTVTFARDCKNPASSLPRNHFRKNRLPRICQDQRRDFD